MRFRWTWKLGRIAGIEVAVHPSWLIIYALFAWSATTLARGISPELNAAAAEGALPPDIVEKLRTRLGDYNFYHRHGIRL